MRFSSAFLALAATVGMTAASSIESRQEAARFGGVSVSPSVAKITDVSILHVYLYLPDLTYHA